MNYMQFSLIAIKNLLNVFVILCLINLIFSDSVLVLQFMIHQTMTHCTNCTVSDYDDSSHSISRARMTHLVGIMLDCHISK